MLLYEESVNTAGIQSLPINEIEYQSYEELWEKLPDYLQTYIVNPDKSIRWNLTYFRELKRRNFMTNDVTLSQVQ